MDNSPNKQNEIDWTRGEFPTWAKMLVAVAVVLLLMLIPVLLLKRKEKQE